MDLTLTGATRLYVIIGDPIAQVKSPGGMTRAFAARGHDGVMVPVQVAVEDLADFLSVADRLKNLDGLIVTVPHKFACFAHCTETTDRSGFIGSTNLMRRRPGGGWEGDRTDGVGFVAAAVGGGFRPQGRRALLIGAGGAGSAIALALIDAGVAELAIHDENAERRDGLIARLNRRGKGRATVGSADPAGFDMLANASPAGMRPEDPLPADVSRLSPGMHVGCVITRPAVTPLIAAARALGCTTSTGTEMYDALQYRMVDFLLRQGTGA